MILRVERRGVRKKKKLVPMPICPPQILCKPMNCYHLMTSGHLNGILNTFFTTKYTCRHCTDRQFSQYSDKATSRMTRDSGFDSPQGRRFSLCHCIRNDCEVFSAFYLTSIGRYEHRKWGMQPGICRKLGICGGRIKILRSEKERNAPRVYTNKAKILRLKLSAETQNPKKVHANTLNPVKSTINLHYA